jgi:hypothetical protein
MHKYSVGQTVELKPRSLQSAPQGEYEIRQLLPASERDPDNPVYRIKSRVETHERVAHESDLRRCRITNATGRRIR